jgi:hypothetical protein
MKMNTKSIYKQVEAVLDAFSSMGHKSAIQFPGRKQAWWTMLPISAEWADQFKKSVLPALRQRMMGDWRTATPHCCCGPGQHPYGAKARSGAPNRTGTGHLGLNNHQHPILDHRWRRDAPGAVS